MKNNMIQAAAAIATTGSIVGAIASLSTGNYLTTTAVIVGYIAVVTLSAMIAADYRRSQRDYTV